MNHEYWQVDGIRIEDVSLEGAYPDTKLVRIFRTTRSAMTARGQRIEDCRFGVRSRIWPAVYVDPEEDPFFQDVYFMEFIGTDPKAYRRLRGAEPCDPGRINWLGEPG